MDKKLNRKLIRIAAIVVLSISAASPGLSRDADNTGQHRYIIRFVDPPLASYRGGIADLVGTKPGTLHAVAKSANKKSAGFKLNSKSAAGIAYRAYLDERRGVFESALNRLIGSTQIVHRYNHAFYGTTVEMTPAQAARVAEMPSVAMVQPDYLRQPQTAHSVSWIGATQVWDGSATGGVEARGEGVIIAVIDTGINTDHPSFAEISPGDDYAHVNPLGDGVFLRDCAPFDAVSNPGGGQPELCNNKLIGVMNYSVDLSGHGAHVSATAAGNLLPDVPFVSADGTPTGIVFDQISGVAPRANIVMYVACGQSGCLASDLVAAIDAATADNVDVINYSIGSGPSDPWSDADSLALLGARDAGIFVATSVSRSGPGPGSIGSPAVAPWLTSVAASTHQRGFTVNMLGGMSGGATTPPDDVPGHGATGSYGPAAIVYAGDFGDPLCPMGEFPPGTFNGDIVLCNRGAYALVDKAESVATGGAGALIIANTATSAQIFFNIAFGLPAIQVDTTAGDALRLWLSGGSGHVGQLGGSLPFVDETLADVIADFSGRGPNAFVPDVISPSVAAPGVDIYAAYYTPIEYASLTGSSLSSAHVAGAAALLRQLHPGWSAAEIHSALASTGLPDMTTADGLPATTFEFGGGRVQIPLAATAGLVLHESVTNFQAANPALGGNASTLNLPSFANSQCLDECLWQRALRATTAGTWTASIESNAGLDLTVTPSVFTLTANETIELTVSADVRSLNFDEWHFGWIHLTPDSAVTATQSLPVAVSATAGIIPDFIDLGIRREAGSLLVGGFQTADLSDLTITPFGLAAADTTVVSIAGETGNFSPFGDTGVGIRFYDVAAGSVYFSAATANSTAPDVDLFVGYDSNADGQIAPEELLCESGNPFDEESCELSGDTVALGGSFWVAVTNYTGSGAGTDDTELTVVVVEPGDGSFYVEQPAAIKGGQPWQIRIGWDAANLPVDEKRFGAISISSTGNQIALIPVELTRLADDVRAIASPLAVQTGGIVNLQIEIVANLTPEDLSYRVDAVVPSGFELLPETIFVTDGNAEFVDNTLTWWLDDPSLAVASDPAPESLVYQMQATADAAGQIIHEITHTVNNPGSREGFIDIAIDVDGDEDGDSVNDSMDNCTMLANADQRDSNGDGIGNACDADINGDCMVNFSDSVIYRSNFMLPGDLDTDNNNDGITDFVDLSLLRSQFFGPPGPSAMGSCTQRL